MDNKGIISEEYTQLVQRLADRMERYKEDLNECGQYAEIIKAQAAAGKAVGVYNMTIPGDLLDKGLLYFRENTKAVKDTLTQKAITEETRAAILQDYAAALVGIWRHQATPEQMREALAKCSDLAAYMTDKKGLWVLLWSYQRCIICYDYFTEKIKNNGNTEERAASFESIIRAEDITDIDTFSDIDAIAWYWLQDIGYITVADFGGVDPAITRAFLDYVQGYGQLAQFTIYTYIARRALNATTEQLKQLTPPAIFASLVNGTSTPPVVEAIKYADMLADGWNFILKKYEVSIQQAVEAETMAEREAARNEAKSNVIQLSKVYTQIASRRISVAVGSNLKDGQKVNDILPIKAVIGDYLNRHKEAAAETTPNTLGKVVEAINLLQQIKRVQPINGIYSIETNISEFAEFCGYKDANQEEKREILTALNILDGMFLILWDKNGKIAKRLFTLETIGLTKKYAGYLKLLVLESGIKYGRSARPNLISKFEIEAMSKDEKGEALRHFRNQIVSKGQKRLDALQDEVFAYSDKIAEAELTEDPQQVKNVREYIRKHKARDKKTLAKMFEAYKQDGIIDYTLTTNSHGEEIYKWTRLMRPTGTVEEDK